MNKISLLKQEKGSTVIIFLFIMSMLAALAVGALQVTSLNVESSNAQRNGKQAFYAAEVGLDLGIRDIIDQLENLTIYTTSADFGGDADGWIFQNNYRNHDVKYKIENPLASYLYQTIVGNGIMFHFAHTFDIEGESASLKDNSKETLREQVRILETPLVQYYIFYGGAGNAADLEVLPGPVMNSWGRIHANGDIYIGTNNAFNLRNYDDSNNISPHFISAGGQIFARRKNNGTTYNPSNVTVKVGDPGTTAFTPTRAIPAGGITDGNETAQEPLFNDYVLINEQQYQAPGQTQFVRGGFYETRSQVPGRPGIDGITIVGRPADGGIRVFVSRPVVTDVTALVLAGTLPGGGVLPFAPVRDYSGTTDLCEDRQGDRFVDFTDIDLNLLGQWYTDYLNTQGLTLGQNGMLIYTSRSPDAAAGGPIPYLNNDATFEAIRLVNAPGIAPQVWTNTTIATDNPVYIQGDFNTVTTQGVAIVADAINILSNGFGTKACNSGLSNATVTSINAALFGGNVPTPQGGGNYSGGLENYPRFHERWTGVNCNIDGSFINLWTSLQADGNWVYGGNRYTAPGRNWGWDVRFGNPNFWPPFIPSIFSVERVGFLE
jgi:hypothetical protein